MNPFRLRLQCLYVYEAPHLTIESFNIILEACPNLRQVISFFCLFPNDNITSSLATCHGGPSTVRASSRLWGLCGTTTWRWKFFVGRTGSSQPVQRPSHSEQHERLPSKVHECILKCKFCCVISSCSLVTFRNVQMINVMHNNIFMGVLMPSQIVCCCRRVRDMFFPPLLATSTFWMLTWSLGPGGPWPPCPDRLMSTW